MGNDAEAGHANRSGRRGGRKTHHKSHPEERLLQEKRIAAHVFQMRLLIIMIALCCIGAVVRNVCSRGVSRCMQTICRLGSPLLGKVVRFV